LEVIRFPANPARFIQNLDEFRYRFPTEGLFQHPIDIAEAVLGIGIRGGRADHFSNGFDLHIDAFV
jgi:hypothetical protein